MLARFAQGMSFNRFEAERVGDHCLHTTISDLQRKHGIEFHREWEVVPNRFGSKTRIRRYWLAGAHLQRAREIAGWGAAA